MKSKMVDSVVEVTKIALETKKLVMALHHDVEEFKQILHLSTSDLREVRLQFDELKKRLSEVEKMVHFTDIKVDRGEDWYVKNSSCGSVKCKVDTSNDVINSDIVVEEILKAFENGQCMDITLYSAVDVRHADHRKDVSRNSIAYHIFQRTGKKPRFEWHDNGNYAMVCLICETKSA